MRPNKKKLCPAFRVTWPYLNLLLKPRFVSGFLEKIKNLCNLKGEMPFKMHKIIFFPEKKMCAFNSNPTETHSKCLLAAQLVSSNTYQLDQSVHLHFKGDGNPDDYYVLYARS